MGFAFLHSGYPGQARKSPYLPCLITIILPHLSHGTSLTLSSITTLDTSFSALSMATFRGAKNSSTTLVQYSLPSSILSNLPSIAAVKSTSTICLKYSERILFTINPSSVAIRFFFSLTIYSLLNNVEIVGT